MKIAIVGSRDFVDYDNFVQRLNKILNENQIKVSVIVSGGARGVDTLAERFAEENHLETKIFKPNWEIGRHAAFLRNTDIVESADIVIAFWDGFSRGTKDSITKAKKRNKRLFIEKIS